MIRSTNELNIGDKVEFIYTFGAHPGNRRRLTIEERYSNGDIGGTEELVAEGEYRRFKTGSMRDVKFVNGYIETKTLTTEQANVIREAINILDQLL